MMGTKGRPLSADKVRSLERQIRTRGIRSLRAIARDNGVGLGTVHRIAHRQHTVQRQVLRRCGCGAVLPEEADCLICAATEEHRRLKACA